MPEIYVNTYAKYNAGAPGGAWVDLSEYDNPQAFYERCLALHADEVDPEFMYSDVNTDYGAEAVKALVSESSIHPFLWQWLGLEGDEREVVGLYYEREGAYESPERVLEKFQGRYASKQDWAHEHLTDSGIMQEVPEFLHAYINFASYAKDAALGGDVVFIDAGDGSVLAFST